MPPPSRACAARSRTRASRARTALHAALAALAATSAFTGPPDTPPVAGTVTASPFAGFHQPLVEAFLYNPPVDRVSWKYPWREEPTIKRLEPTLFISGRGFEDGAATVKYRIESKGATLHQAAADVSVTRGLFECMLTLPGNYPQASSVGYDITSRAGRLVSRGIAPLRWSRFQGLVKYLDGRWRSSYINMRPDGFGSAFSFYVPVADDGRFEALVPARVYSVINVNGTGYSVDAMERWAWDYDLTRDRQDEFTIGRTELYGMHAFNVKGGPATAFVCFRPSALSRILQFDADGDGRVSDEERKKMLAAMKDSPTVIGPVLQASDVRLWLNGQEQKIVQFDLIPENDGDFWQVQYLLQFHPDPRPAHAVWHEIKLEVRSKETLRGREIVDFGQGSVGFFRR